MRTTTPIVRQGRIPDSIYNVLPYIYLLIGIATILLAGNGMAVFSGISLISAGILVWFARYQYRKNRTDVSDLTLQEKTVESSLEGSSMKIQWRKSLESGHPIIDSQHLRLFELGNLLVNKIVNKEDSHGIQTLLDTIINELKDHFNAEEAVMDSIKFPMFESHKEIHLSILTKIESASDKFRSGQIFAKDLVSVIVYDLITDHLISEDVTYFGDVKKRLGTIQ